MDRLIRALDYFFVIRPILFLPVWNVFLAGFLAAAHQPSLALSVWFSVEGPHRLALGMGLCSAVMAAVFITNQISDVETDRENEKLFLIADGYLSTGHAARESCILLVIGVGGGLLWATSMQVIFLAALTLAGAVLYNLRPFSWKDRPFPGLLVNGAGALLIFFLGWTAVRSPDVAMFRMAVPYLLAVLAVYVLTTLPDAEGDRRAGKVTIGVAFGQRTTLWTGCVLELLSVASGYLNRDAIMFYPALVSAPFFLVALASKKPGDLFRTIKVPIFLLTLSVALQLPAYLVGIMGLYLFSKWYYQRRFGLRYPTVIG